MKRRYPHIPLVDELRDHADLTINEKSAALMRQAADHIFKLHHERARNALAVKILYERMDSEIMS